MKQIVQIFITLVAFVILINISLKVFNRIDPWLGIAAGSVSVITFAYTLYLIWKRGTAEAEKAAKENKKD